MRKRPIRRFLFCLILIINILIASILSLFIYFSDIFLLSKQLTVDNLIYFLLLAIITIIIISISIYLLIIKFFVKHIENLMNLAIDTEHIELPTITGENRKLSENKQDLIKSYDIFSDVIKRTSSPIGIFITDYERNIVFLSDMLFEILNLEKTIDNYYPLEDWNDLYCSLLENREMLTNNIYTYQQNTGERKCLKVKYSIDKDKNYGIIIDLTEDYIEKRGIQHNWEIDTLTGLLKRTAFLGQTSSILNSSSDKIAIVIIAELQKLREIIEMYGYDSGDSYIKAAASVFYKYSGENGIVSQFAENQFAILLHGYKQKEPLLDILNEFIKEIDTHFTIMPDGFKQNISFNVGYSWYPADSNDIITLLHYADFAMYGTKIDYDKIHEQFKASDYLNNNEVAKKNQLFNKLMDSNLFDYIFQPIVEVSTGEIYGYEALTRSKIKELKSPMEIFQLAKEQDRLSELEKLTIFNLHEWVKENISSLARRKIFINSIPKQILPVEELPRFEKRYNKYMSRIVYEFSISEQADDKIFSLKEEYARKYGAEIAIDDFFTSRANENLVIKTKPKFIKVSMNIIRSIHKDEKKVVLFRNIVKSARKMNIKVIAIGIESHDELKTVIELGADYVQGFYIKEPEYYLADLPSGTKRIINELFEKRI